MDVWAAKKQKDAGIRGAAGAQKPKPPLQLLRQDGDLKVAATEEKK